MVTRIIKIFVPIFLIVILLINVLSFKHKSLTYDEPSHFRYGLKILNLDSKRFVDGTMPVSALNAVVQKTGKRLRSEGLRKVLSKVGTGRYVTVLFSILTALYVYKWASELYGVVPGLLSLMLYTFSPNIIAHSRLITTDLYATGMAVISTYYFWRFLNSRGLRLATVSAILLGLSQLAKYTCLLLYPIFLVIILVRYSGDLVAMAGSRDFARLAKSMRAFFKFALFFAVVSIVIINIGFLFNKPLTPLGQYQFRSELFKAVQAKFSVLKNVPTLLPYPYVQGLDWGKYREETGKGFGRMYLLGQLRETGGFKGYYLFAFLVKVPIAIQAFILLSIVFYVLNRKRYKFVEHEAFLVCPIVLITVYFNLFHKLQIGIRHFLVAFPFLHVFCGSLLKNWQKLGPRFKALVVILLIYLVVSVVSYFPHYIPYFNEVVWDRKQAYKFLADSNIDWGQDQEYLRQYKKKHSDAYVEEGMWRMKKYREKHMDEYLHPQFPDSGLIVVNVNELVGINNPHRYQWLRDNYEPVDHIGYSYLVFEISPKAKGARD